MKGRRSDGLRQEREARGWVVRPNWNEPCAQSLSLILVAFLSQKATLGAVYPAVYQAHAHMQSESEESGEESGVR